MVPSLVRNLGSEELMPNNGVEESQMTLSAVCHETAMPHAVCIAVQSMDILGRPPLDHTAIGARDMVAWAPGCNNS